jgi:hypothetical protein
MVRIVVSDVGLQHRVNTARILPFHELLEMPSRARRSVAAFDRCLAKD